MPYEQIAKYLLCFSTGFAMGASFVLGVAAVLFKYWIDADDREHGA
jgi:hypothetical protein